MSNETFCRVYSELPLLLYVKDPWRFPWSDLTHRRAGLLVGFSWNSQSEHEACAEWVKERLSDRCRIEILCDTQELTLWFRSQGFLAEFVNENCWHGENLFTIQQVPKKYDLIYVAAATRYKNLDLLSQMDPAWKIAWVCGRVEDERIYEKTAKLENVTVFGRTPVARQEVCRLMNESKVGLCLSTQEASMRSACEYRLCGLPVVNVQTTGGKYSVDSCGREILLGTTCVFTSPRPNQVGVNKAIRLALAAADKMTTDGQQLMRNCYLSDRLPHQARFVDALNRCADHVGLPGYTAKTASNGHFNLSWGSIDRYL